MLPIGGDAEGQQRRHPGHARGFRVGWNETKAEDYWLGGCLDDMTALEETSSAADSFRLPFQPLSHRVQTSTDAVESALNPAKTPCRACSDPPHRSILDPGS